MQAMYFHQRGQLCQVRYVRRAAHGLVGLSFINWNRWLEKTKDRWKNRRMRGMLRDDRDTSSFAPVRSRAILLGVRNQTESRSGQMPVCNARIEVTQPIYMNFGRLRYKSRVRYMI